jgi:WD40 repeat protein
MGPNSKPRPIAFVWHAKLDDFISQLAWSPDGRQLAAASVSGQLGIYDREQGRAAHLIEQAHPDGIDALAWRPDGLALATAGRDGTWRLWDPAEGAKLLEHEAGALWPEHLAWSPAPIDEKGRRLALGAGSRVSFWTEKGEPIGEPLKFPRTVAEVAWISEGKMLAVATSASVSWRDPVTGEEKRAFVSKDAILNLAVSPSAKWMMTGNQDCSVHVWNTESGAEMHMRGYAAKVRQMSWHRGSRWLAAGGGPTVSVWDCSGRGPEGRTPTLLEFHQDQVSALHYQPQGDWLASGARDGSVAIWSPTQRQTLIAAGKISSGVTRVAWSPDGQWLAAAGEAGEIQVLAVE